MPKESCIFFHTESWLSLHSVVAWILAVVAVIGNGLVAFLIVTRRRLRKSGNWFVLSLTVADFIVGVFFFPSFFVCDGECEDEDSSLQPMASAIRFAIDASFANVGIVVLDRYLAVVRPLYYTSLFTRARRKSFILASWILPLTVNIILIITGNCTKSAWQGVLRLETVLFDILPGILLPMATVHILLISHQHSREISITVAQLNYNKPRDEVKIKIKARALEAKQSHFVVVVVSVYMACSVSHAYYAFQTAVDLPSEEALQLLLLINSALNPLAYSLYKRDIKRELKRLFRCR